MAQHEPIGAIRTTGALVIALGAALVPTTAQADCVPAPAAFELCDLDMMSGAAPAPHEDTLVLALGDLWLDMSGLPADFNAMSHDDILDLLIAMNADSLENSDGVELLERSRSNFASAGVTGTTVVMEELADGERDAHVMSIASHDSGGLFLALHGDGSEDVVQLEQVMQTVLNALRPTKVN